MKIYFATTADDLLSQLEINGSINWKLSTVANNNFLGFMIGSTPGAVLDALRDVEKSPYLICGALVEGADIVNGLRAAMAGDVIKTLDVVIVEIIKIN